jgi:hypothetical protein
MQAAWLARWYLLQAGLRSTDDLQLVAWYTWGDPATFHWGTIETDAGAPTQAGIAFNQVYAWLVGAAISQPCSSASDGTWTCSLTRPGGYTALAIWNTQGSKSYTPSATYEEFRDLAGNTVKITEGGPITIGAKPILFETQLILQTPSTTPSVRTSSSLSSFATTSSVVVSSSVSSQTLSGDQNPLNAFGPLSLTILGVGVISAIGIAGLCLRKRRSGGS